MLDRAPSCGAPLGAHMKLLPIAPLWPPPHCPAVPWRQGAVPVRPLGHLLHSHGHRQVPRDAHPRLPGGPHHSAAARWGPSTGLHRSSGLRKSAEPGFACCPPRGTPARMLHGPAVLVCSVRPGPPSLPPGTGQGGAQRLLLALHLPPRGTRVHPRQGACVSAWLGPGKGPAAEACCTTLSQGFLPARPPPRPPPQRECHARAHPFAAAASAGASSHTTPTASWPCVTRARSGEARPRRGGAAVRCASHHPPAQRRFRKRWSHLQRPLTPASAQVPPRVHPDDAAGDAVGRLEVPGLQGQGRLIAHQPAQCSAVHTVGALHCKESSTH